MLDLRLSWLSDLCNAKLVQQGLRGLEKESFRIDQKGQLSLKPHPKLLGSALTNPYLTTDYSEAMLEFVTPPYSTNWEAVQFLCDLHTFVIRNMGDELLWSQSMPCNIPTEIEIPVANYGRSNEGRLKTVYRNGLGYRYGRKMQAISGIHFNYSLPLQFWEPYKESLQSSKSIQDFISTQYMGLIRNYRRHAWLLIYLFGASPALCKSFLEGSNMILQELEPQTWYGPYSTSLRMSRIGYRNQSQAALRISANSLEEYISGLGEAVSNSSPQFEKIGVHVDNQYRQLNTNTLQIENEYYGSIRPKPPADSTKRPLQALAKSGVEYVEVRTLDLSMLDPVGVNQTQLRFLEALLIYCLLLESPPITVEEQKEIDARDLLVAEEGRRKGLKLPRNGASVLLESWALEILSPIRIIAAILDSCDEGYVSAVDSQIAAVKESDLTPSARILANLMETGMSFIDFSLKCSESNSQYLSELALSSEKQSLLDELVQNSFSEQKILESETKLSFGDYLQDFFRR